MIQKKEKKVNIIELNAGLILLNLVIYNLLLNITKMIFIVKINVNSVLYLQLYFSLIQKQITQIKIYILVKSNLMK